LESFVDEPHPAIEGENQGEIINLTDHRAGASRSGQLDLVRNWGPDRILDEFATIERKKAPLPDQPMLPHLVMPAHHDIRESDVILRRLYGNLAAAADRGPSDFSQLLLVPGVGARTIQALAFVSEVVHGAPYRFRDPGRFSLTHGGKDPTSIPGAVDSLRRDDRHPEVRGDEGEAGPRRRTRGIEAAG
jgi:hypothetical protein